MSILRTDINIGLTFNHGCPFDNKYLFDSLLNSSSVAESTCTTRMKDAVYSGFSFDLSRHSFTIVPSYDFRL